MIDVTPRLVPAMLLLLALPASAQDQPDPQEKARKSARRKLDSLARRALAGGKSGARSLTSLNKALGTEADKHGQAFTEVAKAAYAAQAKAQRAAQLTRLSQTIQPSNALKKLLRGELIRQRRYALSFILSKSAYRKGSQRAQQEVDRRVARVREVWNSPTRALGRVRSSFGTMYKKFEAGGALLEALGSNVGDAQDKQLDQLKQRFDKQLDIRDFGYNKRDEQLIDQCKSRQLSNADSSAPGSEAEKLLLKLTNDYRVMMGLEPLRIDDRLMRCANKHSQHMKQTRRFAHVDPRHPQGATPLLRAKKEGYTALVGENIIMGGRIDTPAAALAGWHKSAGHHRNILQSKYHSLGTGQAGAYWTQVFGHS